MFEDSTFESTGRIHTHSRNWMFAAFALNTSLLLTLILIPLLRPEALSPQAFSFLLTAPAPPPSPPPTQPQPTHSSGAGSSAISVPLNIPRAIPRFPPADRGTQQDPGSTLISMNDGSGTAIGVPDAFGTGRPITVVHADARGPVRVSSSVVAGLLIRKVTPVYPPIAVSAHQQGTVVLQATISKAGTIENLRVASGPAMLQQAALDAVQRWAYRPYLLNGQPVEVETTINVVFSLDR
jgi:protein TonB